MVFEQSLSGLIKALRANKRDEQAVINNALDEIRHEVRSKDWDVKAAAVLKLTYLEMLGHPTLLQHSFPVIECMASPKFHIKQIGYLAASQSFGQSTEVILLTHNLIKKDLQSSAHPSTVILALTSLPTLLTASPQLADDLLQDLLRMLTHSKAQLRRIATLVIGKVWTSQHSAPLQFSHVEKIRSGLNDEDPTVVSATVNVMLELARSRKDALPSLLGLAPELFDLLTNSTNNWMLIKVVKLFAILTPMEPRLVRKLLPPLSNLISTTPAFSLLYECIQTVIIGGMLSSPSSEATSLATTCIDKLSSFLSDADQNLRYIALKGLSRLMTTHPHLLSPHHDEILKCIDEEDYTIRLKALELVEQLTERSTCKEVVKRLLAQISPSTLSGQSASKAGRMKGSASAALRAISSQYDKSSPSGLAEQPDQSMSALSTSNAIFSNYRHRLLVAILRLTSKSSQDGSQLYINISNFEWYIDTLVTVAYLSLSVQSSTNSDADHLGSLVANNLLEVSARAVSIRDFTVKRMKTLLGDEGFSDRGTSATGKTSSAILSAAAFIVSEYGKAEDGKEMAEILISKAKTLSSDSGSNASSNTNKDDLVLCAVKCLARWLHSLLPSYTEASLPGIRAEVARFLSLLESNGAGVENQYSRVLKLVYEGMDGPRMPAVSPQSPQEHIENEEQSTEAGEEDPSHNPFANSASTSAPASKSSTQASKSDPQGPPLALSLLCYMLFAYELRPLAEGAQSAVVPPDALDLDTWVGPRLDDPSLLEDSEDGNAKGEVDEYGRLKVQPVQRQDSYSAQQPAATEKKKKSKKRKEAEDDVDSIPIVKLDLGDDEASTTRLASKEKRKTKPSDLPPPRTRPRTPSPPPLILSAGGDMPSSKPAKPSSPAPPSAKPPPSDNPGQGDNSFNQQEDDEQSAVQDPVKVVKVKKKKPKDSSGGHQDAIVKKKKKKKKPTVEAEGEKQDLVDL